MNEEALVWALPLRILPSIIFMVCYAIGGRTAKWVRRFIGPILFVVSNALLMLLFGSFSFKILVFLILIPVLTLPYSTDDERIIYVLCLTVAVMVCGLVFWSPVGILQALITFAVGMFFVIGHPIKAVQEEGMIAFSSVFLIPFMW